VSAPTLVVRFSSLGDVLLCGAVTGALDPVVFVTSERYAQVAQRLPGVRRVVGLRPGEGVGSLARRLPAHGLRVDLHRSLRSGLLGLRLGGRWLALDPQRLRRQLRVAFKRAPASGLVGRFAHAAEVSVAPLPWIKVQGPRDALLVVPGALHATKRWPVEHYLGALQQLPGPIIILGGPGEERLCARLADGLGPRAEAICERGFEGVFRVLGRGRACLGGDSGLVQLCAAAGMPVVTIFGPTCSQDGYWDDRCFPVELALPCRPCARFGRPRCPIGDHRCMRGLRPDLVVHALGEVLS